MRIESLEVENFKLFSENFNEIKDIYNTNLILLNGPNGYGKTTVFDAIELALTGKIKRIESYTEALNIGKNEVYETKILIADPNKQAFVKLRLKENDKIIELQQLYTPKDNRTAVQANNPHSIFKHFESKVFDGIVEITNTDEKAKFLKDNNLDNINDFYDKCCFLSQDENLAFLKENKKDKANGLDFLFSIEEKHLNKINKVDDVLKRLRNKNRTKEVGYINKISDEIKKIKTDIENENNKIIKIKNNKNVEYISLFSTDIDWDNENLDFEILNYELIITEIQSLAYFARHQQECINYVFNIPYKALIQDFNGFNNLVYEKNKLAYAYKNYPLVVNSEKYTKEYQLKEKYKSLSECITKKDLKQINWQFVVEENLLLQENVEEIKTSIRNIDTITSTLNTTNKAILEVNKARNVLSETIKKPIDDKIISDNCCVFCGKPYDDYAELIENIENQEKKLKDLCNESSKQVSEILGSIYTKYLQEIADKIRVKINNMISNGFYENFIEVLENSSKIRAINNALDNIGLKLPELYNNDETELINGYENLVSRIKSNIRDIDEYVEIQIKELKFNQKYDTFYDKDETKFRAVTEDMLNSKLEYIKLTLYNNSLKIIDTKAKQLKIMRKRKDKMEQIYNEIKVYSDALLDAENNYKRKIISDIEPIIYIYTAKILQQKFNGKSMFISIDEQFQDVRLINSLKDKQDVLYSMSSGQLSAVSIAFLLCMNQIYAQNQSLPILLIDDPIQTIDDVNMVGLVDILRFEFPDTQLFISTHEQKFEWYLRYKFEKAERKVKPFNMKEIVLDKK